MQLNKLCNSSSKSFSRYFHLIKNNISLNQKLPMKQWYYSKNSLVGSFRKQYKKLLLPFDCKVSCREVLTTSSYAVSRLYSTSTDNNGSKQKKHSKWLTLPNILTVLRLGISPYIGYLVLCEEFSWAFGLFCMAGATDSIDGWIARNFKGQSSVIGSFIDPLADKILISILTLSLTMVDIIPVTLCGLIILRDVMLVATSTHFHYKHLPPPKSWAQFIDFENSKVKMEPTQISKYNTFLQLGLVAISTAAPIFDLVDHNLLHAYWYLVGSTTVISGLSYIIKDKSAYKIK